MALMNSTLQEIERRLKAGQSPEDIAREMHMVTDVIYKAFNLKKLPKTFHEAVGLEPFREQAVPITSKPGWRVLRS